MEKGKKLNVKFHIIQRLFLTLSFLAMAGCLLCFQLFSLPRDAGSMLLLVRKIVGTGIFFEILTKAIMIASLLLFWGFLLLVADLWLKDYPGSWFEKRMLMLFFANILILFMDDPKYGVPYQLIHGLLSKKGLALVLFTSIAVLISSKCYKTCKGKKRVCLAGLMLLIPFAIFALLTGFRKAFWYLIASYGYYVSVYVCCRLVLVNRGKKQLIAFGGCLGIIFLCGQSLINPEGIKLSMDRTQQMVETMEIYDLIQEREGTSKVPVMGNNEGLLRILMLDDASIVPYNPEKLYRGRRGWLYAEKMEQYLYLSGQKKEEGLGLITSYAQQNGYRYILLVQQDGLEYNMVVDGEYEMLYEGQDMQLYYK